MVINKFASGKVFARPLYTGVPIQMYVQSNPSLNIKQICGNFATKYHAEQCENLKVGDVVCFLRTQPFPSDPDAFVRVFGAYAEVIEEE